MSDDCVHRELAQLAKAERMDLVRQEAFGPSRQVWKVSLGVAAAVLACSPPRAGPKAVQVPLCNAYATAPLGHTQLHMLNRSLHAIKHLCNTSPEIKASFAARVFNAALMNLGDDNPFIEGGKRYCLRVCDAIR
ncbi:hypothetical protein NDU88_000177 [Pleurodeles waltl]|uniref:Uncharacterized protein n=1 Tax=Pleurodeles waltl TaxID=8319 RepID=A0AAV7VSQ3_PLEWA|nr:hypothetical protein NDU88_000177 [Pleurodeles waltl]